MKTFNTKLDEYIKQKGLAKKDFAELIGHDIQSIIYFTSISKPRNPTHAFLMKWINYDPDIDLNYFLKDSIEKAQVLRKVETGFNVNEGSSKYNNIELLEEIKEQNDKILSLLSK